MEKRKKPPITCSECKAEFCAPCGQFATQIDYKTRTGVCKACARGDVGNIANVADGVHTRSQADIDVVNEVIHGDCYNLRAMKQKGFEPGVIVDVGAHIGTFSVLAHSLWPDARIIAIEPNKETFACLQRNAPFAALFNVAIGEPGEANYVTAVGQPGSSFVAGSDWQKTAEWKSKADNRRFELSGMVQCTTLKSVLDQAQLDGDIGLLKLDCEGGEFPLLESLDAETAQQVRCVLGEWHHPDGFDAFAQVARKKLPHLSITGRNPGAIGPFWGKEESPGLIECHHSVSGIGDAITAVYAAAGAAAAGHRVRLYSKQAHWLSRASFPGLEIVAGDHRNGIDLYAGYNESLKAGTCRKQWYADNLARGAGIESFAPRAPNVDKTIGEKRTDSERYVLIAPFSAWKGREWPAAHWAMLAHRLHDEGYEVIAVDGYGDGRRLKETFSSTPAKWFWGQSPEWVTDAMLGASAFIGNDSGMTHLAGMLGVRTIAIHAQVSPAQLWGHADITPVFSQEPCAGCSWQSENGYRKSCDKFGCSALMGIATESVLSTLKL